MNSTQRAVGVATVALLLAALLILLSVVGASPSSEPEEPAPPPPLPARGSTLPDAPSGPMARVAVPRPSDAAPLKEPPVGRTELNTEQWRDYNLAVDDVTRAAREACLRPWAQAEDIGRVEVIVDAILWDGEVVDFGIRGLGDIPDDVLACVAEIAWSTPFPSHELVGEIRLQRPLQIDGRRVEDP